MEEALPAIRVTDPQSKNSRPLTASPPGSPIKNGVLSENRRVDGEHGTGTLGHSQKHGIRLTDCPPIVRPFEPSTPEADLARNDFTAAVQNANNRSDDGDNVSPVQKSPVDPLSQHILKRTSAPGSAGGTRRRSLVASDTLWVSQGSESTSAGKSSSEIHSSENRPNTAPKEKKYVATRLVLPIGVQEANNSTGGAYPSSIV